MGYKHKNSRGLDLFPYKGMCPLFWGGKRSFFRYTQPSCVTLPVERAKEACNDF